MQAQITQLLQAHQVLSTLLGYFAFSALVDGMPDPAATDSKGYRWAYKSLHTFSGNLSSLAANKYPELEQK